MEVKLLKDHNGWKAGSIQDVTEDRANYFVRCEVAEYADGSKPPVEKVIKPKAPAKPKAPKAPKVPKEPKAPKQPKLTKELKIDLEVK